MSETSECIVKVLANPDWCPTKKLNSPEDDAEFLSLSKALFFDFSRLLGTLDNFSESLILIFKVEEEGGGGSSLFLFFFFFFDLAFFSVYLKQIKSQSYLFYQISSLIGFQNTFQ
jgi:hypothetical protein